MTNKSSAIKMVVFSLGVLAMSSACLGQSYWKRTYGGIHEDKANAIALMPDGNIIVAGWTMSFGAGVEDLYLLKIKPYGDTLWTRTYGGSSWDRANAITPTPDGNFIVAGHKQTFNTANMNAYLCKITPDGDTLWTKMYSRTSDDEANAITITPDGNLIVAGHTQSLSSAGYDFYILKITPDNDTIWTKTYGGPGNNYALAITPSPDGNFIVVGETEYIDAGSSDVYILKIKPDGDTLWTKTYGGKGFEIGCAISPTPDGNFIIAGYTSSFGAGSSDVYILKIKPDGDTLWTKTYGGKGFEIGCAISPTPDGNFIIAGYTSSFGAGSSDVYILKIKPDGDTLWTKTYGGKEDDEAIAITPAGDGNFMVVGWTNSFGAGNEDVWLISIIDDRYAYKDVPFTFKIPVSSNALNHVYAPLNVPSGMTVSQGGTISWMPKTDSVYMDHAEFLVADDYGRKDTLTFNIFVNSKDHPNKIINPVSSFVNSLLNDITIRPLSSNEVRFSLPGDASSLRVYDVRGQLLENLSVKGGRATWRPGHAAGRYFAKAIVEKKEMVRPFVVVR